MGEKRRVGLDSGLMTPFIVQTLPYATIFELAISHYFTSISKKAIPTRSAKKCATQATNTLLERAKMIP